MCIHLRHPVVDVPCIVYMYVSMYVYTIHLCHRGIGVVDTTVRERDTHRQRETHTQKDRERERENLSETAIYMQKERIKRLRRSERESDLSEPTALSQPLNYRYCTTQ